MFIPVNEPTISKEAKKNVSEALSTGWLSSSGPFVKQFEEDFAAYIGMKHGIALCNGTAALHVALRALDIGKHDEVIVPAFTMAATWLAVLYTGATPVFVDCDPDTYNIDAGKIEEKITKRTKAIIPVHIYGHACEMDAIVSLAKKYKLHIVEDAAEAHGGCYKGKKCGSFGIINCFSFYANKIITTGEGGMLVTNDGSLAYEARKLRNLYHSDSARFIHEKMGYNYRMTNLQAAVGCGELNNIDHYIRKKQWIAERYTKGLCAIPGISLPRTKRHVTNVYWMYAVTIKKESLGMCRDELADKLERDGIETRNFFYPPERQPVLKGIIKKGDKFPIASFISENGLYLPSGLAITEKQIARVIHVIQKLTRK